MWKRPVEYISGCAFEIASGGNPLHHHGNQILLQSTSSLSDQRDPGLGIEAYTQIHFAANLLLDELPRVISEVLIFHTLKLILLEHRMNGSSFVLLYFYRRCHSCTSVNAVH